MSDIEDTIKRIGNNKGTIGVIVANQEGVPIRTTLDNSTTVQYSGLMKQLTARARHTVRDIDPLDDLDFLRIRTKKHEVMIAPDNDYMMIVIHNPSHGEK